MTQDAAFVLTIETMHRCNSSCLITFFDIRSIMMKQNTYSAATCLLLSAAVLLSDHQLFVKSIGAVNIRGGAAIDDRIAKNNHIFDLHNGRRIQLNSCNCISKINSDCHTIPECQASSDTCINPKGKNKCNESGNYIWQAQSTPPPTPAPVPTQPPAPSSSCGKCVVDSSKPCSAPTECPLLSSPGTCSAPSPQPTNGMECTQDSQCKPITGNPSSRGSCSGVFTTNTVCDTTWTCPPTPSPVTQTLPPTSPPTSNPTDAVTPPPTPLPTPFPTGPQTCPEQYCPTSLPTRKLKATLPRRDVVQCDLAMVSLANYTAPGTTDMLIELRGPANSSDALDLVIAAPHGGGLENLSYIDDRSGNGIVTSKDSYTIEVSELLAQRLIDTYCVGVPYLIINHLHRRKLDANRDLEEATAGIVIGKAVATEAWNKFHTYINHAQVLVWDKFGTSTGTGSKGVTGVKGLLFDVHGYIGNNGSSDASATEGWKDDVNIHGAPFTQWGYRLSDNPTLTSCPLDNVCDTCGSFTHARSLPNQSYECLVRGPNSMGSRVNALLSNVAGISDLCGLGTPSYEYPSPYALATDATYCNDAASGGECHYYSGGFDLQIHERMDVNLANLPEPTLSGYHFNTMQAELPRCIRFGGDTIRAEFAGVLAQATMGFLRDLNGPMPS